MICPLYPAIFPICKRGVKISIPAFAVVGYECYDFISLLHPCSSDVVQKVAQPLGELITTITIPPQLATTILDTPISDAWIPAIKQLEALIESISAHANASRTTSSDAVNVKAAKDLEGVIEGVRIAVSAPCGYAELPLHCTDYCTTCTNSGRDENTNTFPFFTRTSPHQHHDQYSSPTRLNFYQEVSSLIPLSSEESVQYGRRISRRVRTMRQTLLRNWYKAIHAESRIC
jgi:hypothetical protein